MKRKQKKYKLEDVFPHVFSRAKGKKKKEVKFDGEMVHTRTKKLVLFKRVWEKEGHVTCAHCGVEGTYFLMEYDKSSKQWVFNLYGVQDGKEVIMTFDHIIPKSKGGGDGLHNGQVMCRDCNSKKGNKMERKKRPTKADLEEEISKLQSILGQKDSYINSLRRELATMRVDLDKEKEVSRHQSSKLRILEMRVEQLAKLLATPVVIPQTKGDELGS